MVSTASSSAAPTAPTFFLYGEPPRSAGAGFLHLEPLDVRSRRADWSIRLHRHSDLSHLFFLTSGGGDLNLAKSTLSFAAPCLVLVPADATHGFAFERESAGQVLTVSSAYMARRQACSDLAADLFNEPTLVPCASAIEELQAGFGELALELGWFAPGHAAAVEALLLRTFVSAIRLKHQAAKRRDLESDADRVLLARFCEQIELRLRDHAALETYAHALGISLTRLHRVCRRSAGRSPHALVQDRLILEAKRALHYSDLSITEIASDLGFADPAYFSRFFVQRVGSTARAYRQSRGDGL